MTEAREDTRSAGYADRLEALDRVWWKQWLDVQRPYRWNLRRLDLGRTLDVGCGVGRNLGALPSGSVGVDHNPRAVALARARGGRAYTPEAFRTAPEARRGAFDALLLAHVVEHMTRPEAAALLEQYLPHLRPGGRVVVVTPQEAGYRSDPTHRTFFDFAGLEALLAGAGLALERRFSFPFPRPVGRLFRYNEFVAVARRPAG